VLETKSCKELRSEVFELE
jgi:hypothetical protein